MLNIAIGVTIWLVTASPDWILARDLIRAHGWNTTCGQLLNPGLRLWFSSDRIAVIGFRIEKGMRIVAGAPVCPLERLHDVVAEFEGADRRKACYFGAEERLYAYLHESRGRASAVLGAQPVWSTHAFLSAFHNHESLRAQLSRSRNKGVVIREVCQIDEGTRIGVQRVLGEWLETRGLPPLHFLVEPKTIDVLGDRRLFVAERRGAVCGFVVLTPIPARKGYLTEQFVRGRGAPNGTVELALHHAVETVVREGAEYLTMGIVPLSPHVDQEQSGNPPWLNGLIGWARAHARRFYNFGGLDEFKAKFLPERWDPVYVIAPGREFRPRSLYAVASAFTEGHPGRAVAGGLWRAARTELRWLTSPR